MSPHPLAERLVEYLRDRPGARVLDFARGRGRITEALRRRGLEVADLDDAMAVSDHPLDGLTGSFAAAISTHGLLHGTPALIGRHLEEIAGRLESAGRLFAAFGSVRDARFGKGTRLDDNTYAPTEGDEAGVAHAFFDRAPLEALLGEHYEIVSLKERDVDTIAGSWAHEKRPLERAVHWYAIATVR